MVETATADQVYHRDGPFIDVILNKGGLKPENVDLNFLITFLKNIKESFEIEGIGTNPAEEDELAPQFMALIGVMSGSAVYRFRVTPSRVETVNRVIGGIGERRRWADLSPETQKSIKRGFSSAVSKGYGAAIRPSWGESASVGYQTKEQIPSLDESRHYKGETTILVKVVRAGGVRRPAAVCKLPNGDRVLVKGDMPQMKKLGNQLYQNVEVTGTATWRAVNDQLLTIQVIDIQPWLDDGLAERVEAFARTAWLPWSNVTSEEFIRDNRRKDGP